MTSILTNLVIVAGVLILVGCCIIPCVQGLIQWLIETALTKQSPLPYQNNIPIRNTGAWEPTAPKQVSRKKFKLKEEEIVRKMIFSIKVFVTLLDYLKFPQVAILDDLHV
jgi:hypothetical protein